MKKLIIALTCAAVLLGCTNEVDIYTDKPNTMTAEQYISSGKFRAINIITLDSCEYVITNSGSSGGVCHKGNCKNPIHWKVIAKEVNYYE